MAKKLKPIKSETFSALTDCGTTLRAARTFARLAECPQLVKKIESALKSLGGAVRHAERRERASS